MSGNSSTGILPVLLIHTLEACVTALMNDPSQTSFDYAAHGPSIGGASEVDRSFPDSRTAWLERRGRTDIIRLVLSRNPVAWGIRAGRTFFAHLSSLAFDRVGSDLYTYRFLETRVGFKRGQIDWGRVPGPAAQQWNSSPVNLTGGDWRCRRATSP
jgi:hypothetical protein